MMGKKRFYTAANYIKYFKILKSDFEKKAPQILALFCSTHCFFGYSERRVCIVQFLVMGEIYEKYMRTNNWNKLFIFLLDSILIKTLRDSL